MARVAFFGTPGFVLPVLEGLIASVEVPVVFTRPDARRGRSGAPQPSPVAAAAADRGLAVVKPRSQRQIPLELDRYQPLDAAVVVAFGMIIPGDALTRPARGFVNLHYSILPRWRGAAPVVRAIMAGDERTGVSMMRLDEGLDTGPVVAVHTTRIAPEETAGELTERLTGLGSRLLTELLPRYLDAGLAVSAQPPEGVTLAPKVTSEDRRLRFDEEPEAFANRIRALSPRPGATALLEGRTFKVLRARPVGGHTPPGALEIASGALVCGTGGGRVELIEVQPAGKRSMPGDAWARGRQGALGTLR